MITFYVSGLVLFWDKKDVEEANRTVQFFFGGGDRVCSPGCP